jgi:hypothetical protein
MLYPPAWKLFKNTVKLCSAKKGTKHELTFEKSFIQQDFSNFGPFPAT